MAVYLLVCLHLHQLIFEFGETPWHREILFKVAARGSIVGEVLFGAVLVVLLRGDAASSAARAPGRSASALRRTLISWSSCCNK